MGMAKGRNAKCGGRGNGWDEGMVEVGYGRNEVAVEGRWGGEMAASGEE